MTEADWLTCADLALLLNFVAFDPGVSNRRNRLFACACARRAWHLLTDDRSRRAVATAECFADGCATAADLESAWAAASTEDDGGGREVPDELAFAAPASAAWTAAWNEQQAAIHAATCAANALDDWFGGQRDKGTDRDRAMSAEHEAQAAIVRDVFGNPFRRVAPDPSWLTSAVLALAQDMYGSRDFGAMPILADALQDAGCDNADILDHCRGPGPHVRGCWIVDLVLGKE